MRQTQIGPHRPDAPQARHHAGTVGLPERRGFGVLLPHGHVIIQSLKRAARHSGIQAYTRVLPCRLFELTHTFYGEEHQRKKQSDRDKQEHWGGKRGMRAHKHQTERHRQHRQNRPESTQTGFGPKPESRDAKRMADAPGNRTPDIFAVP